MLVFWSILFFVIGLVLTYAVVINPLLRSKPALAAYYSRVDTITAAMVAKFSGIRTKLLAGLLMVASFLVGVHDFVMPIAMGIDWSPVTQLLPPWAYPVISFTIGALFFWLRHLTANTQDRQMAAVAGGASPSGNATVIADTTNTPSEAKLVALNELPKL